jgi:excisionase family DNA binding protein
VQQLNEQSAVDLDLMLYRINDVERLLSLSRRVIYELIRSGRLRTVCEGRSRRVPAAAIREYIALLEKEAADDQAA